MEDTRAAADDAEAETHKDCTNTEWPKTYKLLRKLIRSFIILKDNDNFKDWATRYK
jgi:hypothetical protein